MVMHYDLSLEEVERSKISVDGTEYELAEPDDYAVPELRAINRMWKQIQTFEERDEMTFKEGEEYEKSLDALTKYACPTLPKEILEHKNFTRSKKSSVVIAFFLEASRRLPLKVREPLDLQSPEFKDSTEETSEDGLGPLSETLESLSKTSTE